MLYYHQGLLIPRARAARAAQGLGNGYSFANDFYQVWLTSRELLRNHRNPYSPEMTRDLQIGLHGRALDPTRPGDPIDQRIFPYPAFTDLLFWPAAELPFPVARIAVLCVLGALTIATVLLWLRALAWRPDSQWTAVILLLTLSSYSALEGFYAGQLGLLVAFLLAASVVALQRNRFLLAGILMALTTIKPQVTALAIFYFLLWSLQDWRKRRWFCLAFFATFGLLVSAALFVLPNWIQDWARTLLAYSRYAPHPLITEAITSHLVPGFAGPATLVLTGALLGVAVAAAWRNRAAPSSSTAFAFTLSLLLCITAIAILPGQAVYDHLILLPAIFLLVRHCNTLGTDRVPRILMRLLAIVLFWPWLAATLVAALRPWLAPESFSTAIVSLPVRTAASLPFAVFAILAWTWRVSAATNSEAA